MKKTLTVILLLLPSLLWAQSVEFKKQNFPNDPKGFDKALSNYNRGIDYYSRGPRFFEQSLKYLLEANDFNPNNSELNYAIGTVYNALNLKGEAAEYYKKAAQLNPKFKKEGQRLTAENLQLDMQLDRAIAEYNEYIEILNQEGAKANKKKKAEIDAEIAEIKHKIQECENAKSVTKDTVSIIIINVGKGINSKYPDYSAVVTADEKTMYFTSRRTNTTGGQIPNGDVFYYEDVYQSTKGSDGRWSAARNVKGLINTKDHEGTVAISPDGKKMIIYRHKNNGDLYESTLGENGAWGLPKSLEGINSKQRETHATYSPDGKTIYFVSDNPSYGAKGLDIFKTTYNESEKKWSAPERLDVVNTEYDEDGVFLDAEGKVMYFSSKGHNSIGGYDVFKTEMVDGKPTTVVNMGYPVNTPADEVFFVAMPGGKKAYFNSARKGGFGEKDIYTMLLLQDLELTLTGNIYDKSSNNIIKNASIQITKNSVPVELTYPNPGSYAGTVLAANKYKAVVTAPGYEEQIEYFTATMVHPDSLTIQKDFFLTPLNSFVMKGKIFDEETEKVIPGQIEIVTVMGEETINVNSDQNGYSTKLNRDAVYKVKVTSNGYETYEDMLSINEATPTELEKNFYLLKTGSKGVVKEITLKGNILDKITGAAKTGTITIKDAQNKTVATLNVTDQTPGYTVKIKSNTPYVFTVESPGYGKIEEKVTIKVPKNSNEATKNFYVEVPVAENVLDIRNIYFDYDKYNIREDAVKDLKAVLKIMNEFPNSKVELSGHTDNKGSYQYNLVLSLNRAKAAYDWLIGNGISKSRIKYTYYSFNKPLEPNQNADGSDNPEGRAKNRRVEFKIFNVGSKTINSRK